MADFDTVLRGHVVLAGEELIDGYVAIKDGKVAMVVDSSGSMPEASEYFDHTGCFILPGAIDAQTHSRSQKGQEDFIWATKAAAAGGVTTIVDMPYDAGSLICNAERFNQKKTEAKDQARVDFALYGTVHPDEKSSRISEIVKAGAIGFKFSTFGTDPERFPRISPPLMRECFAEVAKSGLIAGVHNEDDETIKTLIEEVKEQGLSDWSVHTKTRPVYSENLAIGLVYELGADTGCRAHVVHCSNGRGIDICSSYQQQGFDSTIETCIHYLTLCEEEDVARLGGRAKVNPPIRGKKEREALWRNLAEGKIDVVSTDHVSWSLERKTNPNMFDNSSGATGLELLVPLLLSGAEQRGIPLTRVVEVLSHNPARLFSIQDTKGALEQGKDADLMIVKKSPYVYEAAASGHNYTDWSPYDGRTVDYRIERTMLRGQWIFNGSDVLAEPGSGKFVHPSSIGEQL